MRNFGYLCKLIVNKWSSLKGAFSSGVSERKIQEKKNISTAAFDSSQSYTYSGAGYFFFMRCPISIDRIRGMLYSHSHAQLQFLKPCRSRDTQPDPTSMSQTYSLCTLVQSIQVCTCIFRSADHTVLPDHKSTSAYIRDHTCRYSLSLK